MAPQHYVSRAPVTAHDAWALGNIQNINWQVAKLNIAP